METSHESQSGFHWGTARFPLGSGINGNVLGLVMVF
ncbi:hypothetical protein CRC_03254 [Cylindrospermopsis raciborskii CS-505]|nr:hypothetical protein CRC_03254 [Cylindrospermopsis raciborskii CS-505]